jgi:anthranilate synthase component 1
MKALSYEDYDRFSAAGGPVPVFREIPGDLLTPVSAFLAIEGTSARAFLLESVIGGERIARYSFLGREPDVTVEARGGAVIERGPAGQRTLAQALMPALRARLGRPAAEIPGLPRFTGGPVGYLTYDAVRLFERIPDRHASPAGALASFSFYRSLVAFDHVLQRIILIADAEPGSRKAFERAQSTLDGLEEDLKQGPKALATGRIGPPLPRGEGVGGAGRQRRIAAAGASALAGADILGDGASFREAVLRAKEYIAAGDIFQVVISRQQTLPCALSPFSVYRALRMVNPSPYMY